MKILGKYFTINNTNARLGNTQMVKIYVLLEILKPIFGESQISISPLTKTNARPGSTHTNVFGKTINFIAHV